MDTTYGYEVAENIPFFSHQIIIRKNAVTNTRFKLLIVQPGYTVSCRTRHLLFAQYEKYI